MVLQEQKQLLVYLDQIAHKATPKIAKNTKKYSEFRLIYNETLFNIKEYKVSATPVAYDDLIGSFPKLKSRPWGSFFDIKEMYQIAAWLTFVCSAWSILFIMGKDHPHIISAGFIVLITNTVLVQTKMLNKRKKIKLKKKLKKIDNTSKELLQLIKAQQN